MTKEQAAGLIDNVFCDAHFHEWTDEQLKDDLAEVFTDEVNTAQNSLKESIEEKMHQLIDSINNIEA